MRNNITYSILLFIFYFFIYSNSYSQTAIYEYYPAAYAIEVGPINWVEEDEAGYYYRLIFVSEEIYKMIHIEYLRTDTENIRKKIINTYPLRKIPGINILSVKKIELKSWIEYNIVKIEIENQKIKLRLSRISNNSWGVSHFKQRFL